MKSAVLVFPGINRERDMARALKLASGNETAMVWHAETALPKGTDLDSYPRHELQHIAAELNDRPRLCLADRAPAQLMRRWPQPGTAQIRDDP